MSEPFLDRLSKFTPDAGGLNRDALLFAAGRASARPNRGWIALATALAGSQALSLALLWPRPTPSEASLPVSLAQLAAPSTAEMAPVSALPDPRVWSVRHSLSEIETEDRPVDQPLLETGPPLRANDLPPLN
jgi:hypothetical protein